MENLGTLLHSIGVCLKIYKFQM